MESWDFFFRMDHIYSTRCDQKLSACCQSKICKVKLYLISISVLCFILFKTSSMPTCRLNGILGIFVQNMIAVASSDFFFCPLSYSRTVITNVLSIICFVSNEILQFHNTLLSFLKTSFGFQYCISDVCSNILGILTFFDVLDSRLSNL